jgi:hypothetical protein
VHPRAVPGPAPSDEPADGESTADGGKNQSRMISSYLQAKELHEVTQSILYEEARA